MYSIIILTATQKKVRQWWRVDTSHKIMIEKSELNGGFLTPLHYHHRKTSSLIYKTSKHNAIRNNAAAPKNFSFVCILFLSLGLLQPQNAFWCYPIAVPQASLPHFTSSQHMHVLTNENCVLLPLMLFN